MKYSFSFIGNKKNLYTNKLVFLIILINLLVLNIDCSLDDKSFPPNSIADDLDDMSMLGDVEQLKELKNNFNDKKNEFDLGLNIDEEKKIEKVENTSKLIFKQNKIENNSKILKNEKENLINEINNQGNKSKLNDFTFELDEDLKILEDDLKKKHDIEDNNSNENLNKSKYSQKDKNLDKINKKKKSEILTQGKGKFTKNNANTDLQNLLKREDQNKIQEFKEIDLNYNANTKNNLHDDILSELFEEKQENKQNKNKSKILFKKTSKPDDDIPKDIIKDTNNKIKIEEQIDYSKIFENQKIKESKFNKIVIKKNNSSHDYKNNILNKLVKKEAIPIKTKSKKFNKILEEQEKNKPYSKIKKSHTEINKNISNQNVEMKNSNLNKIIGKNNKENNNNVPIKESEIKKAKIVMKSNNEIKNFSNPTINGNHKNKIDNLEEGFKKENIFNENILINDENKKLEKKILSKDSNLIYSPKKEKNNSDFLNLLDSYDNLYEANSIKNQIENDKSKNIFSY